MNISYQESRVGRIDLLGFFALYLDCVLIITQKTHLCNYVESAKRYTMEGSSSESIKADYKKPFIHS